MIFYAFLDNSKLNGVCLIKLKLLFTDPLYQLKNIPFIVFLTYEHIVYFKYLKPGTTFIVKLSITNLSSCDRVTIVPSVSLYVLRASIRPANSLSLLSTFI